MEEAGGPGFAKYLRDKAGQVGSSLQSSWQVIYYSNDTKGNTIISTCRLTYGVGGCSMEEARGRLCELPEGQSRAGGQQRAVQLAGARLAGHLSWVRTPSQPASQKVCELALMWLGPLLQWDPYSGSRSLPPALAPPSLS